MSDPKKPSESTPPSSSKGEKSEKAEKAEKSESAKKAEKHATPASKKSGVTESYALPASWRDAWKICAGVGVLGVAATGAMMFGSGESATRASYSYLFGFCVFLTIALGGLFFVLMQRLTSAGWSVTVRRMAEFLAGSLPVFVLLFLPILARVDTIYPWTHPAHEGGESGKTEEHSKIDKGALSIPFVKEAHAAQEEHAAPVAAPKEGKGHRPLLTRDGVAGHVMSPQAVAQDAFEREEGEVLGDKQRSWLNKNFWYARAAGYLIIWSLLGIFFLNVSTGEDKVRTPALTVKAQKWAPLATVIFGLSLTFAAFDWIMSLDPMWFSTIYGVNIFATSVVSSLAAIILLTMMFRDGGGPLRKVVTVEHYHDLGKLLFGFNIFWAYIGFDQMMLIWYAALPEETPFYHKRWETPSSVALGNHSGDFWTNVSVMILVLHFVIPFLFLMSRNAKRRLNMLKLGAGWMILVHMLDMYWFVLPNFEPNAGAAGFAPAWTDITALLGVGGIYLAAVFFRMTKHPLIPTGDPRLARSIAFQNA